MTIPYFAALDPTVKAGPVGLTGFIAWDKQIQMPAAEQTVAARRIRNKKASPQNLT